MHEPGAAAASSPEQARPRPTRTLVRGLAVLEVLAESAHGLGPTEIASQVHLDKGTVSRLLTTLVEAGYVRRDPAARTYALSTKILHLSQAMSPHLDLRGIARPHLLRLCREVNETVHLGVREQTRVVYIDKVEPEDQPIRMVSSVGETMPLHTTALGKAIMAQYPAETLAETLSSTSLASQTSRSVTDRTELETILTRDRERGYSVDDRENMDNVICVGAALLGVGHLVVGAISISSPAFRANGRIAQLGDICRATARAISLEL